MHVLVILALAMAVGPGGATLRTGCYADSTVVGQVPEGSPVTVKFSLSGQSEPCYKVTTTIGGKTVEGYLPGTAISDLESFDQARKAGGAVLGTRDVLQAVGVSSEGKRLGAGSLLEQAAGLIESGQPNRALSLLEPQLVGGDPNLLALAGAAAWRADDPQRALTLWRKSLAIRPDTQVKNLVAQVERENQGDQSKQRLVGARVLLRYEGGGFLPIRPVRWPRR